jgi:hypothetical protein
MRQATRPLRVGFLGALIILAAVFTAGVHVYLGVSPTSPHPELRGLFLLSALGFLGTVAALYAPIRLLDPVRWLARLGLLAVTLVSIVAYFVVSGFYFDTLGIVDKSVEAFLAIALIVDWVRASRVRPEVEESREEPAGRAAA